MSDHAEKKKDDKPADGTDAHGEKKAGGIGAVLTKMPVMLGGAMAVQAVVMLVGFKILAGGPKAAEAGVDLKTDEKPAKTEPAKSEVAEGKEKPADEGEAKKENAHGEAKSEAKEGEAAAAEPADPKKQVEVPVVEFRAPNKIGGRTFLYDVSIYAVTAAKNKAILETAFKDRGALIKDRVRTIIAQSDPDKLGGGAEPGLETLRRQVRYQLEQIVGENLIDEILVPRCIPFRTDF